MNGTFASESSFPCIINYLRAQERQIFDVLWQMERPDGDFTAEPELQDQFEYFSTKVYTILCVILEALGLNSTREDLVIEWSKYESVALRSTLRFIPGPDTVGSEVVDHLSAIIEGLGAFVNEHSEILDTDDNLADLESYLGRTSYFLKCRKIIPDGELSVQNVMNDYLEAIYGTDFRRNLSISGVIKNFHPDCGIKSLSAAIEFKFANNENELKTALGGLFEDSAGYKGSKDWTRFYSVVYMTGAYGYQEQFIDAFKDAEMPNWKPILVTGPGSRKEVKEESRGTDQS